MLKIFAKENNNNNNNHHICWAHNIKKGFKKQKNASSILEANVRGGED